MNLQTAQLGNAPGFNPGYAVPAPTQSNTLLAQMVRAFMEPTLAAAGTSAVDRMFPTPQQQASVGLTQAEQAAQLAGAGKTGAEATTEQALLGPRIASMQAGTDLTGAQVGEAQGRTAQDVANAAQIQALTAPDVALTTAQAGRFPHENALLDAQQQLTQGQAVHQGIEDLFAPSMLGAQAQLAGLQPAYLGSETAKNLADTQVTKNMGLTQGNTAQSAYLSGILTRMNVPPAMQQVLGPKLVGLPLTGVPAQDLPLIQQAMKQGVPNLSIGGAAPQVAQPGPIMPHPALGPGNQLYNPATQQPPPNPGQMPSLNPQDLQAWMQMLQSQQR